MPDADVFRSLSWVLLNADEIGTGLWSKVAIFACLFPKSARLGMLREGLGDDINIGVDFHAKTSPSVASTICKEVEPLNLMFIEEPYPPENVKAMARVSSRTTVPIATGERLVALYSCRELIEQGVFVKDASHGYGALEGVLLNRLFGKFKPETRFTPPVCRQYYHQRRSPVAHLQSLRSQLRRAGPRR